MSRPAHAPTDAADAAEQRLAAALAGLAAWWWRRGRFRQPGPRGAMDTNNAPSAPMVDAVDVAAVVTERGRSGEAA